MKISCIKRGFSLLCKGTYGDRNGQNRCSLDRKLIPKSNESKIIIFSAHSSLDSAGILRVYFLMASLRCIPIKYFVFDLCTYGHVTKAQSIF